VHLEYTITVEDPVQLEGSSPAAAGAGAGAGEVARSQYQYSVWTFPDEQWYWEQEDLYNHGEASVLYGDPALGTGTGLPLGSYR
jgi:hypothetical protein